MNLLQTIETLNPFQSPFAIPSPHAFTINKLNSFIRSCCSWSAPTFFSFPASPVWSFMSTTGRLADKEHIGQVDWLILPSYTFRERVSVPALCDKLNWDGDPFAKPSPRSILNASQKFKCYCPMRPAMRPKWWRKHGAAYQWFHHPCISIVDEKQHASWKGIWLNNNYK